MTSHKRKGMRESIVSMGGELNYNLSSSDDEANVQIVNDPKQGSLKKLHDFDISQIDQETVNNKI